MFIQCKTTALLSVSKICQKCILFGQYFQLLKYEVIVFINVHSMRENRTKKAQIEVTQTLALR